MKIRNCKLQITLAVMLFIMALPSHASAALTDGLVGYWTFDGKDTNWTTNKTNDLSGQGNTGTLTNMSTTTSPVSGKIGQALKFNGTNNYVSVLNSSIGNPTGDFTVAVWAKASYLGGVNNFDIVSKHAGGSGYTLEYNGGSNYITAVLGGAGSWVKVNGSSWSLNTWHHAVMTFSSNTLKLYDNGILIGNATNNTPGYVSNDLWIGGSQNYGNYWNGPIDDVRIYNRALSATEVRQLYKLGAVTKAASPVTSLTTGLVGYWTFDGKNTNWAANTTSDLSGQGNTGTLTNMSTTTSPISGKIGQGLKFDGSNTVVRSLSTTPTIATALTVSFWARVNSNAGAFRAFFSSTNSSDADDYTTGINIDMGSSASTVWNVINAETAGTGCSGGGGYDFFSGSYPFNTWHFVTVVVNASGKTVYTDGQLAGSQSCSPSTMNIAHIRIGARFYGATERGYLDGSMDDVRIYNRALSASEVAQLYKQGKVAKAASPVTSLTSGLVGYWTFDGKDTPWTSSTAATTLDKSGNGNTGTLTNMNQSTSPVSGKIGQGLYFDGVNDYVNLGVNFSQPSTLTFSAWFRTTSLVGEGIFGQSNATPPSGAGSYITPIGITTSGFVRGELWTGDAGSITTGTSYADGKWHYAVISGNVSTQSLYVDGVFIGTRAGTIAQSWWINTTIGTTYDGGGARTELGASVGYRYFNGAIDDVRVYNRALSATEVAQLYKLGQSKKGVSR